MKITKAEKTTTVAFHRLTAGDVFVDENDDNGDLCLRVSMGEDNAVRLSDGLAFNMEDDDPVSLVEGEYVVKKVG